MESTSFVAGLCAQCRFGMIVQSDRGNRFILCDVHRIDSSFAKYPTLPVYECKKFSEFTHHYQTETK